MSINAGEDRVCLVVRHDGRIFGGAVRDLLLKGQPKHTLTGLTTSVAEERCECFAPGHEGYIVGGAVRDLLLKGQPKDMDILTTATVHQVGIPVPP